MLMYVCRKMRYVILLNVLLSRSLFELKKGVLRVSLLAAVAGEPRPAPPARGAVVCASFMLCLATLLTAREREVLASRPSSVECVLKESPRNEKRKRALLKLETQTRSAACTVGNVQLPINLPGVVSSRSSL